MPASRKIDTCTIKITTTVKVKDYLEKLKNTGLYGKSATEAADRLISRGIESLISEGILKRK